MSDEIDYTEIRDDRIRGEICRIMSEMLDNPDEHGIYPTSKFMWEMETFILKEQAALQATIAQQAEEIDKIGNEFVAKIREYDCLVDIKEEEIERLKSDDFWQEKFKILYSAITDKDNIIAQQGEENRIILECLNGSSKSEYSAEAVDIIRKEYDTLLKRCEEYLVKNKAHHYYCEDSWYYSCHKAEDGCCDDSQGDGCTCGADDKNKEINDLLSAIRGRV